MIFSLTVWVILLMLLILLFWDVGIVSAHSDRLNLVHQQLYKAPSSTYDRPWPTFYIPKPWLTEQENNQIPVLHVRECKQKQNDTLILYSHGNGEDLAGCLNYLFELSQALHVDFLTYDYSGYGTNPLSTMERSAQGVNLTAYTVYRWIRDNMSYSKILVMGYSLGGGPTLHVAKYVTQVDSDSALAGIILISTFAEFRDLISQHAHPWLNVLVQNRWDNAKTLSQIKLPVLLLHGALDHVVPLDQMEKLRKSADQSKLSHQVIDEMGHQLRPDHLIGPIKDWLDSLD